MRKKKKKEFAVLYLQFLFTYKFFLPMILLRVVNLLSSVTV